MSEVSADERNIRSLLAEPGQGLVLRTDARLLRDRLDEARADAALYEGQAIQWSREFGAMMAERDATRAENEDLRAGADNNRGYINSLRAAIDQIGEAIGITRGHEDWPIWIEKVRQKVARLGFDPMPPIGDGHRPQAPSTTDRLDEAAKAIDHIKALGPPIGCVWEGRVEEWNVACDRCRAHILALRLQPPDGTSAMGRAKVITNRFFSDWDIERPKHDRLDADIARAIAQAEAAGFRSAIDKTAPGFRDLGTALRMIHDAMTELAPVGGVPSRDVGPPNPLGEAEDIVKGICAIRDQAEVAAREHTFEECADLARKHQAPSVLRAILDRALATKPK